LDVAIQKDVWHLIVDTLTRTSRNQKGKVAQGVACQRQEKRDKREALPTATFPMPILADLY
jgi:hypothetical protein